MSIELIEERNENSLFMFIPTQKEKKNGQDPFGYIDKQSSFNLKNLKTGCFVSINLKDFLKEEYNFKVIPKQTSILHIYYNLM